MAFFRHHRNECVNHIILPARVKVCKRHYQQIFTSTAKPAVKGSIHRKIGASPHYAVIE